MKTYEIYKKLMDPEQNRIIRSEFISQIKEQDSPLCFYHGTDRFVLNTKSEDRKKYLDAFKSYINSIIENDIDIKLLYDGIKNDDEDGSAFIYDRIMDNSKNYEYGSLYVTTSINRADMYARKGRYFGELGYVVFNMRNILKRLGYSLSIKPDVENILDDVFQKIEQNQAQPIILKLSIDKGINKIVAMESGEEVNFSSLLSTYLRHSHNDLQASFRMSETCSLSEDFVEVDYGQEKKRVEEKYAEFLNLYRQFYNNYVIEKFGLLDNKFQRDPFEIANRFY